MEHHIVISILSLLIRHLSQFLYNEKLEKEKTLLETQLKREFVVHISDESYVAAINETAANLPPNESEIELAKLTPIESDVISVPCKSKHSNGMRTRTRNPLGGTEDSPACDLLIGRVVRFHVAEHLYENGRIHAEGLKPVSRLAGHNYAKLGEQFELVRPL